MTSLPSHGALGVVSTVDSFAAEVPITSVPYRCWTAFLRYRLIWRPAEKSNKPVKIGFRAWDGSAYSSKATIEIAVEAIDGLPNAAAMNYTVDEDSELFNVTLRAMDDDSEHVSILITELPIHGTLYHVQNNSTDDFRGDEIAQAYSEWERVRPIEQFASNVLAVSSFWPAGDDAGNGFPSWHPFREYLPILLLERMFCSDDANHVHCRDTRAARCTRLLR